MIVDEVVIKVEAGAGGNGCLSFRREKFIPRGGPDGGNGGRGGDIVFEARTDVHTLVDFLYHPLFRAHYGQHGKGKNMHGKDAPEVVVRVPVGTLIMDEEGRVLADMDEAGKRWLAARGGRGGRGNTTFATSTRRAPKLAEKGEPGELKTLRLELKMIADVGMVGFPNAGKSTLLSRTTRARPKIADYPFTTLEPQLGVVELSGGRSFVLADVPGLIEGASGGKGLGIKFLRHLERTKLLLHLVDVSGLSTLAELEGKLKAIRLELKGHSPIFGKTPEIIVLTKVDAFPDKGLLSSWVKKLKGKRKKITGISAVTGQGLQDLLEETWKALEVCREKENTKEKGKPESRLYQAKSRFAVAREGDGFHVRGAEVEKWVAMTNFDNPDATERFYKILGRMGVLRELKKMGIAEGDTVFCGEEEMTFTNEYLGVAHES